MHSGLPMLFLVSVIISLAGCERQEPAKVAASPPEVQVTEVVQRDLPVIKEWVGVLDGSVNVDIQSRVDGFVTSQHYQEGMAVKKGDLLFQLDSRPFEIALLQAQAALAKAESNQLKTEQDERRYTALYARQAVSEQDRDNAVQANAAAQAEVLAQKAAIAQARLNIEYTHVVSPVSGIAGMAQVNIGDLVSAGKTRLTTVSTVDPIKAYFSLNEQAYLKALPKIMAREAIPEAQRPALMELVLADGSIHPYKGKFNFADRQIDKETGSITLSGLFPNPGNALRPGQFARVRIASEVNKGALLVPQQAVSELQGAFQIAVVAADNRIEIRPVKPGERTGAMWVIDEGLRPGERIVVEGTQIVRDGMAIIAKPWAPPAMPGTNSHTGKTEIQPPAKMSGTR